MSSQVTIHAGDAVIQIDGHYELRIENNSIHISGCVDGSSIKSKTPKIPEPKEIKQPYYDQERLRSGSEALYGLFETWKVGFDIEGAVQPDRVSELRTCIAHHGDAVLLFLRYSEGLTNALLNLFPALPGAQDIQIVEHAKEIRKIACNMAQVSSITCPEIEYLAPRIVTGKRLTRS